MAKPLSHWIPSCLMPRARQEIRSPLTEIPLTPALDARSSSRRQDRSVTFRLQSGWLAVWLGLLGFSTTLTPAADAPDTASDLAPVEAHGVRLARGFKLSLVADSDIAPDVYCMTLDAKGRVVLSGAGYIQTLEDTNNDGRADRAILFATPRTGAMGLCFDGSTLYACAEGALLRYRDENQDGVADGPPERLLEARFGEHGGHAIRKGPDGAWYFLGGNDSGFNSRQITSPLSPVTHPVAGALFRLSPDGTRTEVVAHGFRNPYDFDFNPAGDLFTYDSDVERDFFLPWYTPTRIYHIAAGGHHGWQLGGWLRSWNRPDYTPDTVEILAAVGRGSPTGVAVYRHRTFPLTYKDGLFVADWTFGRILFCPLRPMGATYKGEPEVFLEPIGTHGFAPTDLCVSPDGALLVSIGGRKTRGAVYRIEPVRDEPEPPPRPRVGRPRSTPPEEEITVEKVLDAPQPLDAWSRARWIPQAQQLGPQPFQSAIVNERMTPARRVRAIEICTELFGGLETARAIVAVRTRSPLVRARVAWSLGRVPCETPATVLLPLASDSFSGVRDAALQALRDLRTRVDPADLETAIATNLTQREKRVRQAVVQLAAVLPAENWQRLWAQFDKTGPQGRLTLAQAALQRDSGPATRQAVLERLVPLLENVRTEDLLLQLLRLIQITLGDWNLHHPSVEAWTAYEPAQPTPPELTPLTTRVGAAIDAWLPLIDWRVNVEAGRVLAMVQAGQTNLPAKIAAFFTDRSSATSDFHYLTVLSRLTAPWPTNLPPRIADTLLQLAPKLDGQEQRTKQTWHERLVEIASRLVAHDPRLSQALLENPALIRSGNLDLVTALAPPHRIEAARKFRTAAATAPGLPWNPSLVDLLGTLPAGEVHPLLRQQWSNRGLREAILRQLATAPAEEDRDKYLEALPSLSSDVALAALEALGRLPATSDARHAGAMIRALRRWIQVPGEAKLRSRLATELARQAARPFPVTEQGTDTASLGRTYAPLFRWFEERYPAEAAQAAASGDADPAVWKALLQQVDWAKGDAARGAILFEQRACRSCHGAGGLGPDLTGAAGRFSVEDLFAAILWPSREVAPPYQTLTFELKDGRKVNGWVAFESADGVIVQTGATSTLRLAEADIVARHRSETSLMPAGLLEGLKAQDLADLYRHLQSLQPTRTAGR